MAWRAGFACFHCGLPVLLGGDARHPGHGVVDELAPGAGDDGLPLLAVLHRFCNRVRRARPRSNRVLRRAWLGWVTQSYEARDGHRCYRGGNYLRLGLNPGRTGSPQLFRRHWQVRKMRCASQARSFYAAASRRSGASATPR